MEKANKKLLESFENNKERDGLLDFIYIVVGEFRNGGNIKIAAEKLGITPGAVRSRIKRLRGKGVKGLPFASTKKV